jgi:hypothetical protein
MPPPPHASFQTEQADAFSFTFAPPIVSVCLLGPCHFLQLWGFWRKANVLTLWGRKYPKDPFQGRFAMG